MYDHYGGGCPSIATVLSPTLSIIRISSANSPFSYRLQVTVMFVRTPRNYMSTGCVRIHPGLVLRWHHPLTPVPFFGCFDFRLFQWEMMKVHKLMKGIREGRITVNPPKKKAEEETYQMWKDDDDIPEK